MKKPTDTPSFVADHEFAAQAQAGSERLAEADQQSCQQANLTQDVIAYSLFGQDLGYCEGAILNAQKMAQIYPDWQMWLFHDASVPPQVIQRLQQLQVHTFDVSSLGIAHWPGTFWRFYALSMPHVRYVLLRDVDSQIGQREQGLVLHWLASGKPFHIMRDWYSHSDLILAGLWGAYAPLLAHIGEWIENYIASQTLHPTHADQEFLAAVVWPRIKNFALIHDSIHQADNITAFPAPPLTNTGQDALGGYRYKLLEISLQQVINQSYQLVMQDSQGVAIFNYTRNFVDGNDAFHLPYEYIEFMQNQTWRLFALLNGNAIQLTV
jgi:hypothetical protein